MAEMNVKVNYSSRRSRTISARLVNDTMCISVPSNISSARLKEVIDNFKKRFERRRLKKEVNRKEDLKAVAEVLNKRYFGGSLNIKSIEYVTDQYRKFGCCNYKTHTIRISHHLAEMPKWVRDYVLIHELAHLIEPNHGKNFWRIVSSYKLTERARGYLMAKGVELDKDAE